MNLFKFSQISKHILSFFCLILVITSVKAQNYAFKHYDANDGLPSSDVFHAIQDSKGYIWFATDNGVSRFNGYEFTNYDISDGLVKNTTLEIFEDYKGRIWFISIRGKLSYYENGKISQYKYNDLFEEELKAKPVPLKSAFYVDSTDNVYLGIEGFGTLKVSDSGKIEHLAIGEKKQTKKSKLIEMPNNKLLVSYYSQRIDDTLLYIKNNIPIPITLHDFPKKYLKHWFAAKITDGEIITSCNKVLYHIKNYIDVKRFTFPFKIHWQSTDINQNIWICGAGNGAWRFNTKKNIADIKLLEDYSVSSVLQDNKNGLWFTTLHNGVFYLPSFNISYFDTTNGLIKNNINAIGKHKDSLWIGYHSNNISLMTGKGINSIRLSNFKPLEVTKIFYDTINKQTVVGSSKYLYFIKSGKITEIKNNYFKRNPKLVNPFIVKDIISDNKGGYWICGGNGFYHWVKGHTVFDSKINKNFRLRSGAVFLDKDNTLYLGTIKGLWKFKNNYLQNLGRVNNLYKLRVLDITKYKGKIIIGTKGGGLLVIHEDSVSQFTKKNGLSSNTITSMDVSSGFLWVGTKNGLDRISFAFKNKHNNIKVSKFTKAHGLLTNEIRFVKAIDSNLFIGTNDGLIKFNIKSIKKDTLEVPLYYKNVVINNQEVPIQKSYELEHTKNNIQINFEGISFKNSNNILYRYKMEGLDNEWNYTKNRELRFSFLPPGNYRLLISAMNHDEVWNEHPVSMEFIINKPFWQRWPYIIAAVFLFFILSYIIFRYRMEVVKKNSILELERKKYVKQALVNQMNPHFIFNALNSINNYILTNNKNKASKYLTKFSGLIRLFLENSDKEYISIAEEINASKLYLEIESNRLKNGLEFEIVTDKEIDQFKTKVPSLIIQPFLENAIWHGIQPLSSKGRITLNISKNSLSLQISIIDNGIGRKAALKLNSENQFKKHSMGIEIIQKRLAILEQLYKEKVSIEYIDLYKDEKIAGTQVIIKLPLID